ncbi:MAG TPA: glycosyltransferase [Thermodesulfobacteriota bacterium]|nr:glycosyltransferase [Thermodesulfobacteriota bacterium]
MKVIINDDRQILFSILIPTLEDRKEQFDKLYGKLSKQITDNLLQDEVEIVFLLDDKQQSIGSKRNKLIELAKGTFVAFIDDDDDVSNDYVRIICTAIKENPAIDCIGIKGITTFLGRKNHHIFIHSLQYKSYFSKGGVYFRPPYHLNPIKREIARLYKFEEVNYYEDIDWAMRISRDQALKKEYFIDSVIYYYNSRRPWVYQFLLDVSEPIRHRLGLQLANVVRLKRWIKSVL